MSRRKIPQLLGSILVLALVATACGGSKDKGGSGTTAGKNNGVYRIETDSFEWGSALDPTAEYLGFAFEFYNALHRPLLGYNHKAGNKGGNDVIPDAAEDTGQVSADGKTWTFKIKKGIKFAPPLNRQVTSHDYVNAFNRLADKTLSAGGYQSYYDDEIVGFQDYSNGKAKLISGIQTPDDATIVFSLTRPVGDWRYRMTLGATAPQPQEITKCFKKNGEYGRFQIATGPYMIEGTDKLDIKQPCDALAKTPISGFDPTKKLVLVRNPAYDAATDTKESRENNVDGIDLELNTNTENIFQKIEQGSVDGESAQPPATVLQKSIDDPTFKDNLHSDPGDRTWYLAMNVIAPPFDDVHIRKAANWVMNKAGLVRARGGSLSGIVAEHIVPPDVLGGQLKAGEFDPYASKDHAGDVDKAKEEMKLSKYDTNKDGLCDASACKNVQHSTRATAPYPDMAPLIEQSFDKIGITLKTTQIQKYYATIQVPTQTPALASGGGWGKDYADASTFFEPLLTSAVITKDATQNAAFLGITPALAQTVGVKIPSGVTPPTADADISNCATKLAAERATCWADLDKKMMNEYVPWIPYLWANNISVISDAVTTYEYDQFAGEVSFVHIAVDPSKQKKA